MDNIIYCTENQEEATCYDFLSLFLFSHHCSITFPFELSFISHA